MIRLRRTVLYVPADKPRALEKAAGLPADAVIIDLEDAVAPDNKEAARRAALAAAAPIAASGKEVAVRINGVDTPWYHGDVTELRRGAFAALVLPKVKTAIDVKRVALRAGMCVWPMMETAQAVLEAKGIAEAAASTGPSALILGTNDLAAELGITVAPGRKSLALVLQLTVVAAKAAGIDVIDGVLNAIDDEARLRQEANQVRMLGFAGKTVIHPAQIEVVNTVFSPKPQGIAEAQRVIEAVREAEAQGSAVATLDGQLVETLHARAAERLLEMVAAIAERESAASDAQPTPPPVAEAPPPPEPAASSPEDRPDAAEARDEATPAPESGGEAEANGDGEVASDRAMGQVGGSLFAPRDADGDEASGGEEDEDRPSQAAGPGGGAA